VNNRLVQALAQSRGGFPPPYYFESKETLDNFIEILLKSNYGDLRIFIVHEKRGSMIVNRNIASRTTEYLYYDSERMEYIFNNRLRFPIAWINKMVEEL